MKKFVLALAAGVMLATGAQFAQANEGKMCAMCASHMDAGKKADEMALVLDLTDKQKAAVKDLADAKMKRLKPLMEQMESQSIQAHDEFEAGVKKVLNAKQQAKFDAWMEMEKSEHKDCR